MTHQLERSRCGAGRMEPSPNTPLLNRFNEWLGLQEWLRLQPVGVIADVILAVSWDLARRGEWPDIALHLKWEAEKMQRLLAFQRGPAGGTDPD